MCVDFDIVVQARSEQEVRDLLMEAVCTYVEDALKEGPATAHRLLNRSAPIGLRIKLIFGWVWHILTRNHNSRRDTHANFELPCPA